MSEILFFDGAKRGYTLYPPKGMQWEADKALQLIETLLRVFDRVGLTVVGLEGKAGIRVLDLSDTALPIEKDVFQALYPNVMVEQGAIMMFPFPEEMYPYYGMFVPFKTYNSAENPLLYVSDFKKDADPLSAICQVMGVLREGEQVSFSVLVNRVNKPLFHQGAQMRNAIKRQKAIADQKSYQRGPIEYERIVEGKRESVWFECYVGVEIFSPNRERVMSIGESLFPQLAHFSRTFSNQPHNGLRMWDDGITVGLCKTLDDVVDMSFLNLFNLTFLDKSVAKDFEKFRTFLEPRELATLWHIPHEGFNEDVVVWKPNMPELSKALAENEEGILMGGALYKGELQAVKMLDEDRATHLNLVGRTGSGKSTLLHYLIARDIEAGKGVAVIDPHGTLVRDILRCSIPPEREQDVVVLDLNRPEHPLPLNIFAGTQSYAAIGRVVDMIERLYSTTGVRMDKYLRAGIRALQYVPDVTMRDLYKLFSDGQFRTGILEQIDDDELFNTLHEEYHAVSDAQRRSITGPIFNRISPFYANPYLYPTLCHPQRIDFEQLIANQNIVLISLGVNTELVPNQERNLVGSLFISLLQMVGMKPNRKAIPFYVYVDEVQNFITTSLPVVFSEARKYGLSITVANQFFGQLPTETLQAIMSNVGATIAFRSNMEDAHALAPYMKPQFDVPSLVNLDKFQAAVKMQYQGRTQDAFLMLCFDPPQEPDDADEREARIRALSVQKYLPMTREAVLTWLEARYPKRRRMIAPSSDSDDFFEN